MTSESSTQSASTATSQFTAADVVAVLRERGWLGDEVTSGAEAPVQHTDHSARLEPCPDEAGPDGASSTREELDAWLREAAALLGPHAADREALGELLSLVFQYDARAILGSRENHTVLAREGAKEVIRELAHLVLEGPAIDSDRFKEIVAALKTKLPFRGRELFHPIRLALAGRAGEGELDRVILLLDRAAALPFRVPVKGNRRRILEFCAAME